MILRKANIYDINDIARVHCDVWNSIYSKYVTPEFLEKLNYSNRKRFWLKYINDNNIVFVMEEQQGAIIGFAVPRINKKGTQEANGEVLAHYMAKTFQGKQYGTALMVACAKLFIKNNVPTMSLWIHRDNPTSAIYRKLGGEEEGAKLARLDNKDIVKIKYEWKELQTFVDSHESSFEGITKEY